MSPALFISLLSFVLGAVIGSFLNVCIYRIPAGESVVRPRSRCPQCLTPIAWYQNIPILSYLLLRGRCGACGVRIAPRYALVEALTGALFLLVLWRFGLQSFVPVLWLFAAVLVVITFIDLDHQIIPDVISLPGIVVGFACSFLIPWVSWSDSLLGILAGGGSLYLVAWLYALLAKKEGMGGGDIKLLAMIGAFLGWKAVFPIIFFSSVLGVLVGVPLMLVKRADGKLAIPFGPFLAAGSLAYLFWGPQIIRWYLGLL
jgi:leader peptidase (prepilin peptidase)/N-methyltransferase